MHRRKIHCQSTKILSLPLYSSSTSFHVRPLFLFLPPSRVAASLLKARGRRSPVRRQPRSLRGSHPARAEAAGRAPCGRSPCPGTFYSRPSPSPPPPTTSCPRTSNWRCWVRAAWARAVSATRPGPPGGCGDPCAALQARPWRRPGWGTSGERGFQRPAANPS